jgi:hypothetical protein
MLDARYFHTFSSRVAASVVGIDNNREGQPVWLPTYSSSKAKFYKKRIISTGAKIFTSLTTTRTTMLNCVNGYFEIKNKTFSDKLSTDSQIVRTPKTTQLHGKRLTSLNEH